ncbi:toll/interleukin-1 receptor domain-containing protein [Longimicrobium sp.]|jgi:hypothetical protein|uniref:toll/interleukin-1 receptor domain-containing protein n=1 Tax=Longimicrobium sp. TaxID=2029185 RepID=UPI002ED9EA1F
MNRLVVSYPERTIVDAVLLLHHPADRKFARGLAARVAALGAVVWLDAGGRWAGDPLAVRVRAAVAAGARGSLAIVSGDSLRSPWMKELASAGPSRDRVLPVVIGPGELPGWMAEGPWADFRDPQAFDAAVADLAGMLDLPAGGGSGIAIEWTDDGPGIFDAGVVVLPPEGRALLESWAASLPGLIAQQRESGVQAEEIGPAASLLAVTRAFGSAYGRVPSPLELAAGTSELARKFNLLYLFFLAIYPHARAAGEQGA